MSQAPSGMFPIGQFGSSDGSQSQHGSLQTLPSHVDGEHAASFVSGSAHCPIALHSSLNVIGSVHVGSTLGSQMLQGAPQSSVVHGCCPGGHVVTSTGWQLFKPSQTQPAHVPGSIIGSQT
jgi:hypothetical protein